MQESDSIAEPVEVEAVEVEAVVEAVESDPAEIEAATVEMDSAEIEAATVENAEAAAVEIEAEIEAAPIEIEAPAEIEAAPVEIEAAPIEIEAPVEIEAESTPIEIEAAEPLASIFVSDDVETTQLPSLPAFCVVDGRATLVEAEEEDVDWSALHLRAEIEQMAAAERQKAKPQRRRPASDDDDSGDDNGVVSVPPIQLETPENFDWDTVLLAERDELVEAGRVRTILPTVLVVEAASVPALDLGAVLYSANRLPVGLVEDTFGPVSRPYYALARNPGVRLLPSDDEHDQRVQVRRRIDDEDHYLSPSHVDTENQVDNEPITSTTDDAITSTTDDEHIETNVTDEIETIITEQIETNVTEQIETIITDEIETNITEQIETIITDHIEANVNMEQNDNSDNCEHVDMTSKDEDAAEQVATCSDDSTSAEAVDKREIARPQVSLPLRVGDVLYYSRAAPVLPSVQVLIREAPPCDASGLDDVEIPVEEQEFSDDEKELNAKRQRGGGSSVRQNKRARFANRAKTSSEQE